MKMKVRWLYVFLPTNSDSVCKEEYACIREENLCDNCPVKFKCFTEGGITRIEITCEEWQMIKSNLEHSSNMYGIWRIIDTNEKERANRNG